MRKKPKTAPAPEAPLNWERADPAELAKFDPATKECTMNCGQSRLDPRSRAEVMYLCDDCLPRMPARDIEAPEVVAWRWSWKECLEDDGYGFVTEAPSKGQQKSALYEPLMTVAQYRAHMAAKENQARIYLMQRDAARRERDELRAVITEKDAEIARLIEDRARFPDRSDFVGSMIAAHIGNLKAAVKQAQEFAAKHRREMELAQEERDELRAQLAADQHSDDAAVNRFAIAMKAKLAEARAKGRSGWDDPAQCSEEFLARLLIEHLGKGNAGTFEDVANFAMMLYQRGADPKVLAEAKLAQQVAGPTYGPYKCFACGEQHADSGNLPCPKMTPTGR